MSDAIKKLHDYLAKSPSVVYPEDVLAYLPAIEDENAKLLEHIDYMHLMRVIDQNENDALRKLVRQMHTCLTRPKAYTGASQPYLVATECPYFTQGVCDYNSCGFERRMRELGMEVDG